MPTRIMDIFTLTENEFFRQLTTGQNNNLHIAYKDFVLQVSNLCHNNREKGFVISALLFVEIEISQLQSASVREAVNHELTAFIQKALRYLRQTLIHYRSSDIHKLSSLQPVSEDRMIDGIDLNWNAKKSELIELGYAFKVANCFGPNVSAKDIINRLATIFKVDLPDNYIYKKFAEMKVRTEESRSYFMDFLSERLNAFMRKADEKR